MAHKRVNRQQGRAAPLIIIAIAAVILIGYLLWPKSATEQAEIISLPEPVENREPETPPQVLEAPDIPRVETPVSAEPSEDTAEETVTLPPLNDSDEQARELLVSAAEEHPTAVDWLKTDSLLRRGATVVDTLSRHKLPITALPVGQAPGTFQVSAEPEDGRIWLDEANYQRYDHVVSAVNAVSAERLVGIFHHMRPLLEQAYGELGYPEDNFDNAVIAAIDHLLEAPVIDTPVELVHETVAFEYADESLENLPAAHRQLLRMGPDHTRAIQTKLREIRRLLVGSLDQ